MAYYYLIASLPSLSLDTPPSLSFAAFSALCAEHLAPHDLAAVKAIGDGSWLDAPPAHPVLAAWREVETTIRNAIVRDRASRTDREAAPFLREQTGLDAEIPHAVAEAFGRHTPLERERAIDQLRWRRLSALAGFDPFAPAAVLVYALHLRIAERWATMNRDLGRRQAEALLTPQAAPPST